MNIDKINNPYLPYSNNRYLITQYGDIIDLTINTKLDLIEKDDGLYVELEWIDGIKLYNAAIVVIVAFRPYMGLDKQHYKDIIPLYRNNNNKDLTPNNLTYKLPITGIEYNHSYFKGFCHIPEYSMYAINHDGIILNIRKNKIKDIKTSYVNDKERIGASVINDKQDKARIKSIYVLLGYTYIEHDYNYEKLEINHINGNCQDNRIENLEWVTGKENVNHAFDTGLTSSNEIIESKNYITNEIKRYRSIKYACVDLNVDFRYFKNGLRKGFIKIYEDQKDWYYIKQEENDWVNYTEKELQEIPIRRNTEGTDIKALNVFTNNVFIFSSIGNAVKDLDVDLNGIIQHIRRDSKLPYHGYIFRYLTDERPFPKFDEEQLYLIKSHIDSKEFAKVPQGYSLVDLETNEKRIFTKTKYLAEFLNIYDTTVQKKLKNHKDIHIFNNKYKVTLIKPEGTIE